MLLAAPVPKIKAYPCYTLVAEKLEAMVHLGETNSRMKDFYDDSQKKIQWKAFIRKAKVDVQVGTLGSVVDEISRFIMPVLDAIKTDTDFDKYWNPSQGWGAPAE